MLPTPIDMEAFERGEFALINVKNHKDLVKCFADVSTIQIKCASEETPIKFAIGGTASIINSGFSYSDMEIIVSNTFLRQHYTNPEILSYDINVESDAEEQIYNTLDKAVNPTEVEMVSRYAVRQSMQDAKQSCLCWAGEFH